MDFASEALANSLRIKVLTIVAVFCKEAVDLVEDFGNSCQYVTRGLDQAARLRGYLKAIQTDQGQSSLARHLINGRTIMTLSSR